MELKQTNIFYISAFLKSQTFLLPVLYLFYLENGLSLGDFFLFQGLIFTISVLLQIPFGILGSYIPRKYLVIFSYVTYLLRIFLWLFYRGYFVVLLGEIFYAISKAMFDSVEAPYVWEMKRNENSKSVMIREYSKLNFALCAGVGVASVLGAFLYEKTGFYTLLILEFTIITISTLLSFFIPFLRHSCFIILNTPWRVICLP